MFMLDPISWLTATVYPPGKPATWQRVLQQSASILARVSADSEALSCSSKQRQYLNSASGRDGDRELLAARQPAPTWTLHLGQSFPASSASTRLKLSKNSDKWQHEARSRWRSPCPSVLGCVPLPFVQCKTGGVRTRSTRLPEARVLSQKRHELVAT